MMDGSFEIRHLAITIVNDGYFRAIQSASGMLLGVVAGDGVQEANIATPRRSKTCRK